jgi:hypothetical protein
LERGRPRLQQRSNHQALTIEKPSAVRSRRRPGDGRAPYLGYTPAVNRKPSDQKLSNTS